MLGDFVKQHPNVQSYNLRSNMMNVSPGDTVTDPRGFDQFLDALEYLKFRGELQIKHLNLSMAHYQPEQLTRLMRILSDSPIEEINLSNCGITNDPDDPENNHLKAIADGMTSKYYSLKTINLKGNHFNGTDVITFQNFVEKIKLNCPNFTNLDLNVNRVTSPYQLTDGIAESSPAAQVLGELTTAPYYIYVHLPQDKAVTESSQV